MTDIAAARIAIETHFNTAWAARTPIAWENDNFDPPDGAFVRFRIDYTDGGQAGTAAPVSRRYRNEGTVMIDVLAPPNIGTAVAMGHAKAAKDIFDGLTLSPSGIRFFGVSARALETGGDGYGQRIIARFQHDEIK